MVGIVDTHCNFRIASSYSVFSGVLVQKVVAISKRLPFNVAFIPVRASPCIKRCVSFYTLYMFS